MSEPKNKKGDDDDEVRVIKVKVAGKKTVRPPRRTPAIDLALDRIRDERKETMYQVQSVINDARYKIEDAYQRDITDLRARLVDLEQYRVRDLEARVAALESASKGHAAS